MEELIAVSRKDETFPGIEVFCSRTGLTREV
jgi:hypothetical protein